MKNTFSALFWSSFFKTQGAFVNIIGLALGYVAWAYTRDQAVSLFVVVPIVVLFLSLIVTVTHLAVTLYHNQRLLPAVVWAKKQKNGAGVLCLLAPSRLFSYDTYVSFYSIEGGKFEQLIGIGYVVNIQENGYIQVILAKVVSGSESIAERLSQNDKGILEQIIVKPNVPREFMRTGAT